MKVISVLCTAVLLCFSALAAAQTVVPLEMWNRSIPALHASVNGHAGFFLFDTGGGISVIDKQIAQASGCTPWGRVTGFRMTGERLDFQRCDNVTFDIGGVHANVPTAGLFDVDKLTKGSPHVDGSLALDIFAGKAVTLDVGARTLTIETPASLARRIRVAMEIPVSIVRDSGGAGLGFDVGVPTPRGMAWMELDSGMDGPFVIADHVAPLFGLQPDLKTPQPVNFTLGKNVPLKGTAITAKLIMDGNIGKEFFSKWAVTFDLKRNRVWVAPTSARDEAIR